MLQPNIQYTPTLREPTFGVAYTLGLYANIKRPHKMGEDSMNRYAHAYWDLTHDERCFLDFWHTLMHTLESFCIACIAPSAQG